MDDRAAGKYGCVHCGEAFPRRYHLQRHVQAKHAGSGAARLRYTCAFPGCAKVFTRKDNRDSHERKHALMAEAEAAGAPAAPATAKRMPDRFGDPLVPAAL